MLKIVFSILILGSFANAANPGFSKGNELSAAPIQGQVRVICNGFNGSGTALFTCRDVVADPQAYDYFLGPQDGRADKVELTAYRQDGSTRTKQESYNGAQGKSSAAINLWISTLFQKPLLAYGANRITFKIYSNAAVYATGEFNMNVSRSPARTCPAAQYNSTDINDCNSQYTICQQYFEEHHYCR